jgi:exopolysaccharide biosynthesis WecB/TagA/CpsF family protein
MRLVFHRGGPVAAAETRPGAGWFGIVITMLYQFDNFSLDDFLAVAAGFGQNRYGYVVTPNADHMIRLYEDPSFRALYADAEYVLMDSRFLSHLLRITRGLKLPVCAGSDLTAQLFARVIHADDGVVLIGGSDAQARMLAERYGLRKLAHHNPPMGFLKQPEAVEACLAFVEAHSPFRFCLIGVGSPQQEVIAQQLRLRGRARGLALCVGASIDFLTGVEKRAPRWMRRIGLEWLYRLLQNPERLAARYLRRGPRVFGLLRKSRIELRSRPGSAGVSVT